MSSNDLEAVHRAPRVARRTRCVCAIGASGGGSLGGDGDGGGGGIGGGLGDDGGGCASTSSIAQGVPVFLVFMFDRSGSMAQAKVSIALGCATQGGVQ